LASGDVAHALEALALVAERDGVSARWQRPSYQPLKCARRCYGHLAGELGVAQLAMLLRCAYLQSNEEGLQLTEQGRQWLASQGISLPARTGSRMAYLCMDWSERKDHLAGTLAKALLEHYLARDWLRQKADSRALSVTPAGQAQLIPLLAAQAA
jgi:hypothetical protein